MKITNIEWDVGMNEVHEFLDEMSARDAAEALELPYETYASMSTSERHDHAFDYFRHRPGAIHEFLGLPEDVEMDELIDEEDVADRLSDIYGYCINTLEVMP